MRGLTITVAFMIHMLSERGLLSAPRMKSFGLLSQFFFKNSKLALSARMLAVNRYSRLSFVLNICTELAPYLQFMVLFVGIVHIIGLNRTSDSKVMAV